MPLRRFALLLLLGIAAQAQAIITLDGASAGEVFEGVGGVSGGGISRLLIDYPEPYRSQILDYLFKPNFGASLQHLKIEIGGDENSGSGAEPSYMRSPTGQNYYRGYELWLMQQAKNRRPDITLDALEWGAPGWIGGGQFYSQDNINYIINFLVNANSLYGLPIAYVGIWDESPYNIIWIEQLKAALQAAGLSTQIVAADQTSDLQWRIADDMIANPALMAAVDVIGEHYPGASSSSNAQATGKRLWSSEDGPWRGDWAGAQSIAQTLIRNYPFGRMTATALWALITSYYDLPNLRDAGLMLAQTPWSGNYTVEPAIWAVAHLTQFAQPGWRYLDSGCGSILGGIGNYITLKSPNGTDYSTIVETKGAYINQTLTFQIQNGLSTGAVHVWESNASMQFVQESDITPVDGSFSITLAADSIYSLTTTTGQSKGYEPPPPPDSSFPFPYYESFDQYSAGATPAYFSDYSGAFETSTCGGSRSGLCLRQVVATPPIAWTGSVTGEPATYIGDVAWTDYQESADTLFEQPGSTVKLYGRVSGVSQKINNVYGYLFDFDSDGNWGLFAANSQLASGTIAAPQLNTWHSLKLIMNGPSVQGVIDGATVVDVNDATFTSGLGGLGTSWENAQFDNFTVDYLPGSFPVSVAPGAATLAASGTQQFTASVTGGSNQVTWSISPDAGTIDSTGLYTAPAFVAASQSVIVTATSSADTSKSGTAMVALVPVSVSVFPAIAALTAAQQQQFTDTVAGAGNAGVTWSLAPNIGSLSPTGLYLAPSAIVTTQTVTVTATSTADSTKSASAAVTLSPPMAPAITQQPQSLAASMGEAVTFGITASGAGLNYQWQSMAPGAGSFGNISGATSNSYTLPAAGDGTQFRCVVSNGVASAASNAATLSVVPGTPFVLSAPVSALRNNFTGWAGMTLTTGNNPLNVSALGRICVAGNSGTHAVKFVNASSGVDVPGGSVQVNMSGCEGGQFRYASVASPITLQANTSYYLVAQEFSGGDQWYDHGAIMTASDAAVNNSTYSFNGSYWSVIDTANTSYIAPNFIYTPVITEAIAVTVQTNPAGRMFAVDGTAYTATQVFNWAAGSSHTIAAVNPQSGGTGSQYVWSGWSDGGALSHTVAPAAAMAFTANFSAQYLLSSAVSPPGAGTIATNPSPASGYYAGTAVEVTAIPASGCAFDSWSGGLAGTMNPQSVIMAAPLAITANFQCTRPTSVSFITGYALNGPVLRNDFSGWVGMAFTVGSSALTVSSLGRICVAGNAGSHILKLAGADVAGGSASVDMAGCTPGTFLYVSLSSPITLSSGASYYLASQESVGGDQWYDYGAVSSTNDAAVNDSAYSYDGANWISIGAPNSSYGPLSFQYSAAPPGPPDLTIAERHSGNIIQGDTSDTFIITVSNAGGTETGGTVATSITVPSGLTALNIVGAGWTCTEPAGPCSRDDALPAGASYPALILTVSVLDDAPATVTSTATVSGGEETNDANDTASDTAAVEPFGGAVNLVTAYALNGPRLRNDFSGWVGMQFTVGADGMTVNSLGRIFVAGNSGAHTVELVRASDGAPVPGASVLVPMAGGSPGQFSFAALPSPVTLQPNVSYYLVTQETLGGDQWYDWGTLATTAAVSVTNAVYSYDGVNWIPVGGANMSYVPPNLE